MKILVVAGIHRDERNAIAAAQDLKKLGIAGVTVIPRATPGYTIKRKYRNQDPNRLWCSAMDYQRAIKAQLRRSQPDLVLDLHSATTGFRNLNQVRYDRVVLQAKFPSAFHLVPYTAPVIVEHPAPPGSFRDYCQSVAGIPCFTYEIGSGFVVERALVRGAVASIVNLVEATMGLGKPIAKFSLAEKYWIHGTRCSKGPTTYTLGQRIAKGTTVGSKVIVQDSLVISDRHPRIRPKNATHTRRIQVAHIVDTPVHNQGAALQNRENGG